LWYFSPPRLSPAKPPGVYDELKLPSGKFDNEDMECPACGAREFLVPALRIRDLLWLVRLKRPIECYPCCCVFLGSALQVLRWQLSDLRPRLPRIKVRVQASGPMGTALETLVTAPPGAASPLPQVQKSILHLSNPPDYESGQAG
jgi:hypothetical protein